VAEVAPLNIETHPNIAALRGGERIRIVSAWARPGVPIAPTLRTIVVRAQDVPQIVLSERTVVGNR
jgi:hypothetical protein